MELSELLTPKNIFEEKLLDYNFTTFIYGKSGLSVMNGKSAKESIDISLSQEGHLAVRSSCFSTQEYELGKANTFDAFPFICLNNFTRCAICDDKTIRYSANEVHEYLMDTYFIYNPETSITQANAVADSFLCNYFNSFTGVALKYLTNCEEDLAEFLDTNYACPSVSAFLACMPREIPVVDMYYWTAIMTGIKRNCSIL